MTVLAVRPPGLADEIGELALAMSALLLGDRTSGAAVRILTSLALNVVPQASGAGISLVGPGDTTTSVAATSDLVLEADALQYHLGEGPCLDACRQSLPVQVADLRRETRWPAWTRAVSPLNIESLMSLPLINFGRSSGAIKIYCDLPEAVDEQAAARFGELARAVAQMLGSETVVG